MRTARTVAAVAAVLALAAACSTTYKAKPEMNYYHGPKVPEGFISVLRASPTEITFEVHVKFPQRQMYHLVLEGNDPVAEGWYSVVQAGDVKYTVTMKPKKDRVFESGKTYRLCIGSQNPQQVQMTSNNYQCIADFTFVFEEKS